MKKRIKMLMQIVQHPHQIYLLLGQPPCTVKLGPQICLQTFYEPEEKGILANWKLLL